MIRLIPALLIFALAGLRAAAAAPAATPAPAKPAPAASPAAASTASPAAAPKAAPAPGAAPKPTELPPTLLKARELAEKKDFEGAMKLLRAEAEKGNAEAANALGEMYFAGRAGKSSAAEALPWFQKAADASLPAGMFNLASLLAAGGEGVPKNDAKARFLTKAAAEAGHSEAQVRMGKVAEIEAASKPGAPDYSEARSWFEKAAAQENPSGLLALGRFADNGWGVTADPVKATEYFRRAARAGSPLAMNEMGVRYQRGQGLPEDHVAAVGWFSLGAQYGQPAALVNLGYCYEIGNGALRDLDVAGRNYAAAAKQNFGPAEMRLAEMLEEGKGAPANLAHAYVLYTRAAAQGSEEAKKKAAELKAKLTPAQLEEAEKMLKTASQP